MDILKREELIRLFDIYKGLLTPKQQAYFIDYYYSDLSLSEIAMNYNVSRNAVYDMLKKVEQNILDYENILKINKKNNDILKIIDENSVDALKQIKEIIEE